MPTANQYKEPFLAQFSQDIQLRQELIQAAYQNDSAWTDFMLNGENAVKAYRVDRGMTQKQLAGEIGINAVYLSQIEAGKGTGSTRTRTKLADTLNVSLEDLL